MSLWKRTRALETQVETLDGLLAGTVELVANLRRRVSELERDNAALSGLLGRRIDELEEQLRQAFAVTYPAESVADPVQVVDLVHADPDDSEPEPAAPELTEKQAALVQAVNELREASTGDIARYVGRAGEGDAVGMALQKLKKLGVVAHNGRRAKGARWLAVEDAPAPEPAPTHAPAELPRAAPAPAASTQAPELTDHDERILRLVQQHGPCTHVFVADQLVKNRRETGTRMRDLARAGYLIDLDGAFATPDLAEAA